MLALKTLMPHGKDVRPGENKENDQENVLRNKKQAWRVGSDSGQRTYNIQWATHFFVNCQCKVQRLLKIPIIILTTCCCHSQGKNN